MRPLCFATGTSVIMLAQLGLTGSTRNAQPSPPQDLPSRVFATDPRIAALDQSTRELVLKELDGVKANCETNSGMRDFFDCDCYAREVLAARLKAGTETHVIRGQLLFTQRALHPSLGACVSTPKIEKYGAYRAEQVGRPQLSACVGRELAVRFRQQPVPNIEYIEGLLRQVTIDCHNTQGTTSKSPGAPPVQSKTPAATPPGATPAPGSAAATTPTSPARPAAHAESRPASAGPEPMTRWRVALLTLRHVPELLTDKVVLEFTTRLIQDEQGIWARIDQYKTGSKPTTTNPKPQQFFLYEWQKVIDTQPEFARGALLDVFMKPDADWSFVKREREWDDRLTPMVGAFLFAREKIEGRQPAFAAQELAPVTKRHLELAIAAAPTNLWFPMKLAPWEYDFAGQLIRFRTGELLETPKGWFDPDETVLPPSAAGSAMHAAIGTVGNPLAEPKETRPGAGEPSGTEKWRYRGHLLSIGANYGALALDRQLFLTSIPVDPKTAERLALKRTELQAKVHITATRVELGESRIERPARKFAVLFATLQKIEVYAPDNELIGTVKPDALPGPKAVTVSAPPAAPKPAPSRPPVIDPVTREREERERRERSEKVLEDLKNKSDDQLERSKRATACMQQTLRVHPNQDSPAFKRAFSECTEAGPPAEAQAQSAAGAPAGPAWQPCGGDLKSDPSQTAVPVEFVNTSTQPRKLIWFDFAGARIVAGVLQPGQRAPMQTYTTHAWMIADESDTCLGTTVISKESRSIEIR
jgi:hypothetical protein